MYLFLKILFKKIKIKIKILLKKIYERIILYHIFLFGYHCILSLIYLKVGFLKELHFIYDHSFICHLFFFGVSFGFLGYGLVLKFPRAGWTVARGWKELGYKA